MRWLIRKIDDQRRLRATLARARADRDRLDVGQRRRGPIGQRSRARCRPERRPAQRTRVERASTSGTGRVPAAECRRGCRRWRRPPSGAWSARSSRGESTSRPRRPRACTPPGRRPPRRRGRGLAHVLCAPSAPTRYRARTVSSPEGPASIAVTPSASCSNAVNSTPRSGSPPRPRRCAASSRSVSYWGSAKNLKGTSGGSLISTCPTLLAR